MIYIYIYSIIGNFSNIKPDNDHFGERRHLRLFIVKFSKILDIFVFSDTLTE